MLRGMHTYPIKVVSSHSMMSILRHGDIEWVVECLITYFEPHFKVSKHPKEIEQLVSKYERDFGDLPPSTLEEDHQTEGWSISLR